MNDPNSAEYDLLHVGGNYNHHGLLHQHQQPLTSPAEYEDPSLLLPGLIDTHFADAVPPTSYYGGPVSCAQVAPASWLTPLPTAVTMDARGAAVSTDAYHSYILDQPTFRYDSLVDPNATYYQPMSEPMAYHCGNDVLIESQENYAKKLTPETAVSDDAEILLATGFADASEVRSRSRSRRRRVPHLVKGGGGACDTSQADLMQSFEIKMDERPHSAASAVASTVINTSTITTSSASCLPVSSCLICGDKATGRGSRWLYVFYRLPHGVESSYFQENLPTLSVDVRRWTAAVKHDS
ncbi:unnamed protein product [Mesocestoides corti]|uniref:Uncharacterized protein n=2 Tax=Mesocestoides corti TaxID=53468 RepID=A0A0R3U774_MESCO|nr:unnamed protein product [Mesocestoides corti]